MELLGFDVARKYYAKGLSNMLPSSAMDHGIDGRMANSILKGQSWGNFATRVSLANIANRIFGQLRVDVVCAEMWATLCSTLDRAILHIVGLCSQKQMVGVDATRIIALMKYPKAVSNWPLVQFVGETVCSVKPFSRVKRSVAVFFSPTLPRPTIVWPASIYFFPETLRGWTRLVLMTVDKSSLSRWKLLGGKKLSATALAKPRWIRGRNMGMLAFSMPSNVLYGMAFDLPSFGFVSASYRSLLSATALAISVWDFVRGIIHGSVAPFSYRPKLRAFRDAAGHFLLGLLLVHFSIFERVVQYLNGS